MASLKKAIRKAYRSAPTYQLDMLLVEEKKWKRRIIIASNKVYAVRRKINTLAKDAIKKEVVK